MRSGAELRQDVICELTADPQVSDPAAIGIGVGDGAVTLTGRVATLAESQAAAGVTSTLAVMPGSRS